MGEDNNSIENALRKAKLFQINGGYVYNEIYLGEMGITYPKTQKMLSGYKGEEFGAAKLIPWKVPYMSGEELDACEVFVKNGKLFDHNGQLISTTGAEAIFVMDDHGAIF